jgi:hypothetical protein
MIHTIYLFQSILIFSSLRLNHNILNFPRITIGKVYCSILARIVGIQTEYDNHRTLSRFPNILNFTGELSTIIPNGRKIHTLYNFHFKVSLFFPVYLIFIFSRLYRMIRYWAAEKVFLPIISTIVKRILLSRSSIVFLSFPLFYYRLSACQKKEKLSTAPFRGMVNILEHNRIDDHTSRKHWPKHHSNPHRKSSLQTRNDCREP